MENKTDTNSMDSYSALGTSPTCDVCGKYVQVGEKVKQMFVGKVTMQDGELVVREENYGLAHLNCDKVN